ncbi:MAG: hypothetical protein ACE5FC_06850 [Myxococcota bacterium]
MRKKAVLTGATALAALVFTFALLEVFFSFYGKRFPFLFRHALEPAAFDPAAARNFLEGGGFDPDLGWDADPIARNEEKGSLYFDQSYGDSFTRGAEVGDDATWQSLYFGITGRRILNLGVNGYGLDQAVLKFEKYGGRYRAPYAILALNYQEYRRIASYYSFHCFAGVDFGHLFRYAFKPIFLPAGSGWNLRLPPCRDADCLSDLLLRDSTGLRAVLSEHDLCYRENLKRPLLAFPYTANFIRALAAEIGARSGGPEGDNYALVSAEAFALVKHLVTRFTRRCEAAGVKPLVLLIYAPEDLPDVAAGKRLDARVIAFLRESQIPFVDSADYIIRKAGTDAALSAPLGHFNKKGNRLIAEALLNSPLLSGEAP